MLSSAIVFSFIIVVISGIGGSIVVVIVVFVCGLFIVENDDGICAVHLVTVVITNVITAEITVFVSALLSVVAIRADSIVYNICSATICLICVISIAIIVLAVPVCGRVIAMDSLLEAVITAVALIVSSIGTPVVFARSESSFLCQPLS